MPGDPMQAVVCYAPFDYRVEEIPKPRPGLGEVLLKVDASGICASDMKCYSGSEMFWGPNGAVRAPVVPGHEFVGTVADLGEGAAELHGVKVGDRALAEQIIPVANAGTAARGVTGCASRTSCLGSWVGRQMAVWPSTSSCHDGAGSPRSTRPYQRPTPRYRAASLCYARGRPGGHHARRHRGPGRCRQHWPMHAPSRPPLQPGQLVAIDTKPYRLELAMKLGADVVINPIEEDAPARVRQLTEGYGCDVYIEATGNPQAPQQGLNMLRRLGTLVAFSVMSEPVMIDWNLIGDQRELNIHGCHLGPYCYPKAIEALAAGTITVQPLISGRYPLSEFPAAMEAARSGENLKTLLIP